MCHSAIFIFDFSTLIAVFIAQEGAFAPSWAYIDSELIHDFQ